MNSALRTLIILGFFVFVVGAGALVIINRSRTTGLNASPTPGPLDQTPAPTVYPFASTTPFPLLILPSPAGSATPPRATVSPSPVSIVPTSTTSCQFLSAAPVEGTAPLSVSFTATGLGAQSQTIREYEFDFGEPGQNPVRQQLATATHRYDNAGSYTARLRLRDSQGNLIPLQNITGDCTRVITVRTKLQAAASPTPSKNLPNTGPETSLMLLLIPVGVLGLYLYRRFRLL